MNVFKNKKRWKNKRALNEKRKKTFFLHLCLGTHLDLTPTADNRYINDLWQTFWNFSLATPEQSVTKTERSLFAALYSERQYERLVIYQRNCLKAVPLPSVLKTSAQ